MILLLAISGPVLFIYFAIFVARCYAVMLGQSSTGLDRVQWPMDTLSDWMSDGWHVLLTFAGVVGLTLLVAVPCASFAEERWQTMAIVMASAAVDFLLFPIALCAGHDPKLLVLLPIRIGPTLRAWAMTMPLAAVAGLGLGLSAGGYFVGPIVVMAFGPPAILVHARAWGRLAWLVLNERPRPSPSNTPTDRGARADAGARHGDGDSRR